METHQDLLKAETIEIKLNDKLDIAGEDCSVEKNDLISLIPTIMNQKRTLRKIMLSEFAKEYQDITNENLVYMESDKRVKHLKVSFV